jgi:hypothetical protein
MLTTAKPTKLDEVIDAALEELKTLKTTDPEYTKTMDRVKELYALKEKNTPKRVSPDAMAAVIGNLAITVLVLNYERAHVVTTKAFSFLVKR